MNSHLHVFRRIAVVLTATTFGLLAITTLPSIANAKAKTDTNACTWFSTIDDWQRLDDSTLIVWGPGHQAYKIELAMPLVDLSTAPSIAFIDHNRDGRLCGFGLDEVVIPHSTVFGSSTIVGMTKLSEADLVQLGDEYHLSLKSRHSKAKAAAASTVK